MKIIKNIFLPILGMFLFTFYLTYFPNTKISIVLYVMIISFVFGTSIYSYYYIFKNIYPDKRNPETPPQFLPKEFVELSGAKQTTAFKLTVTFSLITLAIGFAICYYLPLKFKEEKLNKDGIKTIAVITHCWHSRIYAGDMRDYEFKAKNGKTYTDFFKNSILEKGDKVEIIYSAERPEINKEILEDN